MTSEELNEHIRHGTINEVIRVAEAKQKKQLSKIADEICADPMLRVVLICGASSAGKTTTAKRVCTQLMVNDRPAMHLSTDDYFVGDKLNPRDENGELDYEHVNCVDIPRLATDVNALMRGEAIPRRRFDFIQHEPTYTDEFITLPKGGFVVIEGIHALNPILTEGIDDRLKFRLFIDPIPGLDIFGGITPTSADARFLRRMVRDNQFRKLSPVKTVSMWPKVLEGERKWIDPFRRHADAAFNSYLIYELSALKYYVGGLLEFAKREIGENGDAGWLRQITNMMRLLKAVLPISPEAIPGDSILRETIGGSQLEY